MRLIRLTTVAATVAAVALAAACGGGSSGSSGGKAYEGPVGDGEGALTVLAWPGYAEDGSTDPAVDWVTPFEKETGCQVDVKTFATSNEAYELFTGGGYDVVSASGDASLRLVASDAVAPVNTDLVPNYADIIDGLKDQAWNTVDGVNYGIPHGRGANLLLYNLKLVPTAPDSWSAMWESDSAEKGKISPYDDAIYIADAAVYLMATKPDLKIKNPYALDQDQFDAAIALLEQQKPLVGEYWGDYLKQADGLSSGTITQAQGWQLTANLANTDADIVGTTKPKEGATGWSDTWMVAKDATHVNCAYKWLNHVASPEVQAQIAEWFGEAPANAKACDLTVNPDHCDQYHATDDAFWTDVWYWTTPETKCLDGRTDVECVPYSKWVEAWTSLRSA